MVDTANCLPRSRPIDRDRTIRLSSETVVPPGSVKLAVHWQTPVAQPFGATHEPTTSSRIRPRRRPNYSTCPSTLRRGGFRYLARTGIARHSNNDQNSNGLHLSAIALSSRRGDATRKSAGFFAAASGQFYCAAPVHGRRESVEPVAQLVEHLTFNQGVPGSSPGGLTNPMRTPGIWRNRLSELQSAKESCSLQWTSKLRRA